MTDGINFYCILFYEKILMSAYLLVLLVMHKQYIRYLCFNNYSVFKIASFFFFIISSSSQINTSLIKNKMKFSCPGNRNSRLQTSSFKQSGAGLETFHVVKHNGTFHVVKHNGTFHLVKHNRNFHVVKHNGTFHLVKHNRTFHVVKHNGTVMW